jgi:hypothetical protein
MDDTRRRGERDIIVVSVFRVCVWCAYSYVGGGGGCSIEKRFECLSVTILFRGEG